MTDRLYYEDSRLTEFSAKVVAVEGVRVYLDRTAFYPTSGGQPFDVGDLAGGTVVDVVDEGERIAHVCQATPLVAVGDTVSGRIDWARRFDHMQQHTGQHLLSAVFEELLGHRTVSVHFGDEASTLDLDTPSLSRDDARNVERRANEVVFANPSVTVTFEDAATVTGLRKPPDRAGMIRVVTIDGIDRSACGGTHVRSAAEITVVAIRRLEKYKQMTRVEFLCGWRALNRARADFDALSTLAGALTAAIDDLPALVVAQAGALRRAERDLRKLADEIAGFRARERWNAAAPGTDGVRRILERTAPLEELRALAQALSQLPKSLFIGTSAAPPTVVVGASEDSGVNAGVALKAALGTHGGRGGGSPRIAQGTVADAAALDAVVASIGSVSVP